MDRGLHERTESESRLVINAQEGQVYDVNTGIPQGSPASPVLSAIYLSEQFAYMEERVPGIQALSFVDDVAG